MKEKKNKKKEQIKNKRKGKNEKKNQRNKERKWKKERRKEKQESSFSPRVPSPWARWPFGFLKFNLGIIFFSLFFFFFIYFFTYIFFLQNFSDFFCSALSREKEKKGIEFQVAQKSKDFHNDRCEYKKNVFFFQ